MTVPWEYDRTFKQAARLLWPDDYEHAWSMIGTKGRAAARRRMATRHEGWSMLRKLRALRESVDHAERELRGES